MQYFIARSVFRIAVEGSLNEKSFEELTFFLEAEDSHKAYEEARCLSRSHESAFVNINHRLVTWKFEGITYFESIERPQHGSILMSELKEDYSPLQLENMAVRMERNEAHYTYPENIPNYIP